MITTVFGKPRAGKSTMAAWAAGQALRRRPLRIGCPPFWRVYLGEFDPYDYVYSNFAIDGCMKIHAADLGRVDIRNSLIIMDEAALNFNARDYKKQDRIALDWLRLHGHYKCDVLFLSQSYDDCDKVIRALTVQMLYIERKGDVSVISPIDKTFRIDETIQEGYSLRGMLSSKRLHRKRYYHLFDSFEAPILRQKTPVPW